MSDRMIFAASGTPSGTDDRLTALRKTPVLNDASSALLVEGAAIAIEQSFERGDFIYAKGDPADCFYILLDGKVGHPEVQAAEEQFSISREVESVGQLFGYAALVQGLPKRVISARCERATKVLAIDGRKFQAICRKHGREGHEIIQRLSSTFAAHELAVANRCGWVSVRNVQKIYDPFGKAVVALDDCSVELRPGEFCAVVGPSGCGKSTLLNAIAGFDTLTGGAVYLDGEWINRPGSRPKPGPDRIVVFQNGALFPWATIRENLIRGPIVQKRMPVHVALERARELLARVGLSDIEDLYPGALSSGMCRRVEIIRALLNDPRVILLDEPFRGLDALTRTVTQNALLELFDLSLKTILFITHDLEEAIYLADRVLVMTARPGHIKQTIFVDLPRPRSTELLSAPEFLTLKEAAIEAVHEEAAKAFAAGDRELA
jgi:NitT/TauT family transport system ATP-binding protein